MTSAQLQPASAPGRPMGAVRLYGRIPWDSRDARRLIVGLLGLIWVALCAGALEPVVVAVLTDSVLSGKAGANAYTGWLLRAMPAGHTAQVVGLAVAWLVLRLLSDVCTLAREMINNRLRYNGT